MKALSLQFFSALLSSCVLVATPSWGQNNNPFMVLTSKGVVSKQVATSSSSPNYSNQQLVEEVSTIETLAKKDLSEAKEKVKSNDAGFIETLIMIKTNIDKIEKVEQASGKDLSELKNKLRLSYLGIGSPDDIIKKHGGQLEEAMQKMCIKEYKSCQVDGSENDVKICCKGTVCQSSPFHVLDGVNVNPERCSQVATTCTKNEECCTGRCEFTESSNKKICRSIDVCVPVKKVGEECDITANVCESSDCRKKNLDPEYVGYCKQGTDKCQKDADCCSEKCSKGSCQVVFECMNCIGKGGRPNQEKKEKCCEGYYQDLDGACAPLKVPLPPTTSFFDLKKILNLLFPEAHAQLGLVQSQSQSQTQSAPLKVDLLTKAGCEHEGLVWSSGKCSVTEPQCQTVGGVWSSGTCAAGTSSAKSACQSKSSGANAVYSPVVWDETNYRCLYGADACGSQFGPDGDNGPLGPGQWCRIGLDGKCDSGNTGVYGCYAQEDVSNVDVKMESWNYSTAQEVQGKVGGFNSFDFKAEKTSFKQCYFNTYGDIMGNLGPLEQNARFVLMGFEFVAGNPNGLRDYYRQVYDSSTMMNGIYSFPHSQSAKYSIRARLAETASVMRTRRSDLLVESALLDREMMCNCVSIKGMDHPDLKDMPVLGWYKGAVTKNDLRLSKFPETVQDRVLTEKNEQGQANCQVVEPVAADKQGREKQYESSGLKMYPIMMNYMIAKRRLLKNFMIGNAEYNKTFSPVLFYTTGLASVTNLNDSSVKNSVKKTSENNLLMTSNDMLSSGPWGDSNLLHRSYNYGRNPGNGGMGYLNPAAVTPALLKGDFFKFVDTSKWEMGECGWLEQLWESMSGAIIAALILVAMAALVVATGGLAAGPLIAAGAYLGMAGTILALSLTSGSNLDDPKKRCSGWGIEKSDGSTRGSCCNREWGFGKCIGHKWRRLRYCADFLPSPYCGVNVHPRDCVKTVYTLSQQLAEAAGITNPPIFHITKTYKTSTGDKKITVDYPGTSFLIDPFVPAGMETGGHAIDREQNYIQKVFDYSFDPDRYVKTTGDGPKKITSWDEMVRGRKAFSGPELSVETYEHVKVLARQYLNESRMLHPGLLPESSADVPENMKKKVNMLYNFGEYVARYHFLYPNISFVISNPSQGFVGYLEFMSYMMDTFSRKVLDSTLMAQDDDVFGRLSRAYSETCKAVSDNAGIDNSKLDMSTLVSTFNNSGAAGLAASAAALSDLKTEMAESPCKMIKGILPPELLVDSFISESKELFEFFEGVDPNYSELGANLKGGTSVGGKTAKGSTSDYANFGRNLAARDRGRKERYNNYVTNVGDSKAGKMALQYQANLFNNFTNTDMGNSNFSGSVYGTSDTSMSAAPRYRSGSQQEAQTASAEPKKKELEVNKAYANVVTTAAPTASVAATATVDEFNLDNINLDGLDFGADVGSGATLVVPKGVNAATYVEMLSVANKNKKIYEAQEDDSLFLKVSKAYVRSLPKLLIKKKPKALDEEVKKEAPKRDEKAEKLKSLLDNS